MSATVNGPPISAQDLVKRYGSLTAVAGISFSAQRGTCLGLLGPNGAGKTTSIEVLEGLMEPDGGEVRVLGRTWREDGRALFLADSAAQRGGPAAVRVMYTIEEARVGYERARRKQLARTVTLALRYSVTASNGRLLAEDRCRETFSDTIRRAGRAPLESEAFPETQGTVPRAGWMRRYLEPAVLAAATAITVYLFFNLRSDRSDDAL